MEKEKLAEFVSLMIYRGYITYDDLLPIIKEGTSKMIGLSKEEIFKPDCRHENRFYCNDMNFEGEKIFCTDCDKRIK